jgi:endonuclease YncB( thermonuclease family)
MFVESHLSRGGVHRLPKYPGFLRTSVIPIALKSLLVLLPLFAGYSAQAHQIAGIVARVIDGDTVQLAVGDAEKSVRLLGIDAPEIRQDYGVESRAYLNKLVGSRKVQMECIGSDRYKREICKIVFKGADINLRMVSSGMAWHYKRYSGNQSASDSLKYSQAEESAKVGRVGLWSQEIVVAPWDFRKKRAKK